MHFRIRKELISSTVMRYGRTICVHESTSTEKFDTVDEKARIRALYLDRSDSSEHGVTRSGEQSSDISYRKAKRYCRDIAAFVHAVRCTGKTRITWYIGGKHFDSHESYVTGVK